MQTFSSEKQAYFTHLPSFWSTFQDAFFDEPDEKLLSEWQVLQVVK